MVSARDDPLLGLGHFYRIPKLHPNTPLYVKNDDEISIYDDEEEYVVETGYVTHKPIAKSATSLQKRGAIALESDGEYHSENESVSSVQRHKKVSRSSSPKATVDLGKIVWLSDNEESQEQSPSNSIENEHNQWGYDYDTPVSRNSSSTPSNTPAPQIDEYQRIPDPKIKPSMPYLNLVDYAPSDENIDDLLVGLVHYGAFHHIAEKLELARLLFINPKLSTVMILIEMATSRCLFTLVSTLHTLLVKFDPLKMTGRILFPLIKYYMQIYDTESLERVFTMQNNAGIKLSPSQFSDIWRTGGEKSLYATKVLTSQMIQQPITDFSLETLDHIFHSLIFHFLFDQANEWLTKIMQDGDIHLLNKTVTRLFEQSIESGELKLGFLIYQYAINERNYHLSWRLEIRLVDEMMQSNMEESDVLDAITLIILAPDLLQPDVLFFEKMILFCASRKFVETALSIFEILMRAKLYLRTTHALFPLLRACVLRDNFESFIRLLNTSLVNQSAEIVVTFPFSFMNEIFNRTCEYGLFAQAIWYITLMKSQCMPISAMSLQKLCTLIEDTEELQEDVSDLLHEAILHGIKLESKFVVKVIEKLEKDKDFKGSLVAITAVKSHNPQALENIPFNVLMRIYFELKLFEELDVHIKKLVHDGNIMEVIRYASQQNVVALILRLVDLSMYSVLEVILDMVLANNEQSRVNESHVTAHYIRVESIPQIMEKLDAKPHKDILPLAYRLFMYASTNSNYYHFHTNHLEQFGKIDLSKTTTVIEIKFLMMRTLEYIFKTKWSIYGRINFMKVACPKILLGKAEDPLFTGKRICLLIEKGITPLLRITNSIIEKNSNTGLLLISPCDIKNWHKVVTHDGNIEFNPVRCLKELLGISERYTSFLTEKLSNSLVCTPDEIAPVEFVATAVPPVRIRLSEIFKTIIVSMLQSNGLNKRESEILELIKNRTLDFLRDNQSLNYDKMSTNELYTAALKYSKNQNLLG